MVAVDLAYCVHIYTHNNHFEYISNRLFETFGEESGEKYNDDDDDDVDADAYFRFAKIYTTIYSRSSFILCQRAQNESDTDWQCTINML